MMTFTQAIREAYTKDQYPKHEVIYKSARGDRFQVLAKNKEMPENFSRLNLNEIVDGVKASMPLMRMEEKTACAAKLKYMSEHKIEKSKEECLSCLRVFFECLINLLYGYGFKTAAARALALHQELLKSIAATANAPSSPPIVSDKAYPNQYGQEGASKCNYRIATYKLTEDVFTAKKYQIKGTDQIVLIDDAQMLADSAPFHSLAPLDYLPASQVCKTHFEVLEDSVLNLLVKLKQAGTNPVGLSLANAYSLEGEALDGSSEPDASIARCSSLVLGLKRAAEQFPNQQYKLPELGGVYTAAVPIFRYDEDEGFAFMPKPETAAIVSVASYDLRPGGDGCKLTDKAFADGTKEKIRQLLRIMALKGHRHLVLGALGCGTSLNHAPTVADFFKAVFLEPEFFGRFAVVLFAIRAQHHKDKLTVDTFKRISDQLNRTQIVVPPPAIVSATVVKDPNPKLTLPPRPRCSDWKPRVLTEDQRLAKGKKNLIKATLEAAKRNGNPDYLLTEAEIRALAATTVRRVATSPVTSFVPKTRIDSFRKVTQTKPNQDRFVNMDNPNGAHLLGVMDGHAENGEKVAGKIYRELNDLVTLEAEPSFEHLIHQIDAKIRKEFASGGAVLALAYISPSRDMTVASLGNCEVYIYRKINGVLKAIPCTCIRDYTSQKDADRLAIACDEPEKQYLALAPDANPDRIRYHPNPKYRKEGQGLTTARAIGNREFRGTLEKPAVISKPKTVFVNLQPNDFGIIATDGLWKYMDQAEIINLLQSGESHTEIVDKLMERTKELIRANNKVPDDICLHLFQVPAG